MVFATPSPSLRHILESFKPEFSDHQFLDLPGVYEAAAPFRTGQNVHMLVRTERGLQTLARDSRHNWHIAHNCTLGDAENNFPQLFYPFHLSPDSWSTNLTVDHSPHIVGGIHPESKKTYCYMGWVNFRGSEGELIRQYSGFNPQHSDFIGVFPESMRIIPKSFNQGFTVIERDRSRLYIHGEPNIKSLKALCEEGENLRRGTHEVEIPANIEFHIDQSFGLMGSSLVLIGRAFTQNKMQSAPVACVYTHGDSSIRHFVPLAHPNQYKGDDLRSVGLFMELQNQRVGNGLYLHVSTNEGIQALQYESSITHRIVTGRP